MNISQPNNNFSTKNNVSYNNRLANSYNYYNNDINKSELNTNFNPYGITFDNQNEYIKQQKLKYKEDLDYLMWLKNNRKNAEYQDKLKEYLEYKNKCENLNAIDNMNKMQNRQIQRDWLELQKDNLENYQLKKRQQKEEDLKLDKEYINQANYYSNLESIKQKENKQNWNDIAFKQYEYYKNKEEENKKKKHQEDLSLLKSYEQINKEQEIKDQQYKTSLNNKNSQIYKNLINHSDYINSNTKSNIDEPYYLMNDLEFNKHLANKKEQDRLNSIKANSLNARNNFMLAKEENQQFLERERLNKINSQKYYKDFLDKQYLQLQSNRNIDNNSKNRNNYDLLPSYRCPTLPIPIVRKAADSIHLVKNNVLFKNQNVGDMNQFFNHDVQDKTLIDQRYNCYNNDNNQSKLKNNVIVNPIDNNFNNKYIINNINNQHAINLNSINRYTNNYDNLDNKNSNPIKNDIKNNENNEVINESNKINNNNFQYNNDTTSTIENNLNNVVSNNKDNKIDRNDDLYSNSNNNNIVFNKEDAYINNKVRSSPHKSYNYAQNIQNNKINNNNNNNNNDYNNNKYYSNNNKNNYSSINMSGNNRLMSTSNSNTLITKLKDRIKVKGIIGLFNIRSYLEYIDISNTYMIDFNQFYSLCKEFNLGFSLEESKVLFSYLDDNKTNKIRYEELLAVIVGNMSQFRRNLVIELYNKLSRVFNNKFVEEIVLKEKFNPNINYHNNIKSKTELVNEFNNNFNIYFYRSRVSSNIMFV